MAAFFSRIASMPAVEVVALTASTSPRRRPSSTRSAVTSIRSTLSGRRAGTHCSSASWREMARAVDRCASSSPSASTALSRATSTSLDVATVAGEQIDVSLVASTLDRSARRRARHVWSERRQSVWSDPAHGRVASRSATTCSARCATHHSRRAARCGSTLRSPTPSAADRPTTRDLAERARHACLAGQRFDPVEAADLARRAGDAAADATDYGEAAAHYRRALGALDLVARRRRDRPPRGVDPPRRRARPGG